MDRAKRNELALPEMQRRYVWPATRVRDLLDSLYREYPSGSILVWEGDADTKTRNLSVEATEKPTTPHRQLILDGQQRITSLTAVLSGEPIQVRKRKRPIEILFNLEHPEGPPVEVMEVDEADVDPDIQENEDDERAQVDIQAELRKRTFVVASRALQSDPLWVLVSDIFKKSDKQILSPIGINSDDPRWDKYSERLHRVRKIADYKYVMETLEKDKSYEEVTEIFVRVNSLGAKLRSSDLALAQITSKWKGFMDLLEEFSEEFKGNEDYFIKTGLGVRLLVVFATHQSKFRTVGRLSREELEKSWEEAKRGLRFALNFLRSNAHIEKLDHLSSPFLMVAIAVFAVLKDEKFSPEEEKKLLRWFYLAHMRGHYSVGSAETYMDADIGLLFKGRSLDDLIKQLEAHVKKFDISPDELIGRGIRSPFFSMLYFVVRDMGAKDWWSGIKLSDRHAGATHSIQWHHIFPKSLLRGKHEQREINEIANLAFIGGKTNRQILNKEPATYIPGEVISKRGEEALTSQLIPTDSTLWQMDRYEDFLEERRKLIADAINAYMKRLE